MCARAHTPDTHILRFTLVKQRDKELEKGGGGAGADSFYRTALFTYDLHNEHKNGDKMASHCGLKLPGGKVFVNGGVRIEGQVCLD